MRFSHIALPLTLTFALTIPACTIKDITWTDTGPSGGNDQDEASVPPCSAYTEQQGANLGLGGYADSTASSGAECACQTAQSATSASFYVRYTNVSGVDPTPKRVDIQTPFDNPNYNTPTRSAGTWSTRFTHSSSSAVRVDGTYTVFQSTIDSSDNPLSCSDIQPTALGLEFTPSGPPPAPSSSSGDEDAMACAAGAAVKARFQLAYLPGRRDLLPLFASGDDAFDGLEIAAVKVVDWGEVDELVVTSDAGKSTLTPSTSEFALPEGGAWLRSTRFEVGDQVGQLPTVELEGSCLTDRAPMFVDPGYVTTADALVPWLESSARVVARVVQDGRDDTAETHHLMFELEGTGFAQGIPLTQLSSEAWEVEFVGENLNLDGELTRHDDGLTLEIFSGDMLGVGDLSGRSITFAPYPG